MEDLPLMPLGRGYGSPNGKDQRVEQAFRRCARHYGDRIALTSAERSLTYAELDAVSDGVALTLRAAGVRVGEYVAFSVMHREDAVVAMLAILKAGCAYVPIEPDEHSDQIAQLLRNAHVRVLLNAQERSDFRCVWLVCPDAALPATGPLDADAVACLMFTSGTTAGRKAVMVPHRGILRLVDKPHYVELGRDVVMLQLAPTTFDASTFEIWGALLTGGRLVVYPHSAVDAGLLERLVRSEEINTVWLTSGLFHALARHRVQLFSSLRTLLTGGDVVRPESVRQVFKAFPYITIVNGYGPTENSTFTCCHAMTSDEDIGDSIPIGKPIADTSVHILDSKMIPVPDGDEGELYCGGLGVARGYLGDPGLTAQRFVAAPWDTSEILYRTGDRVRALADGTLIFLGRNDDQVKVRGHRVMLGEVQHALRSINHVEEAVVEFVGNEAGNRLVAHVQINASESHNSMRIKAILRTLLPDYAVPDIVKITPALELTQRGKLKRNLSPRTLAEHSSQNPDGER